MLLGSGYLGSAYVDYGLGNFAFYDNTPPENQSGSLVITATGRHIDDATWRPAVIVDDLPRPLLRRRRLRCALLVERRKGLHRRRHHGGRLPGHHDDRDLPGHPSIAQTLSVDG